MLDLLFTLNMREFGVYPVVTLTYIDLHGRRPFKATCFPFVVGEMADDRGHMGTDQLTLEQPEAQSPQPLSFEVGLVRPITEQPWW